MSGTNGHTGLNISVLGAGYWGPNLIRVFDQLPGARVHAICDRDQGRLDAMRTDYKGASLSIDADEVIDNDETDAVIIALPASQHYEYARRALGAGKHCFVEKPLALKSAECRELIELADQRGVTLMVGHTFEYNAAVQRIKSEIEQGNLGDILQIISQRLNLGQVRQDVDAIWNLAPHDISIALFWLDGQTPEWISAQGFSHLQEKVADMGTITLGFGSGTIVHIIVSWLSPDKIRKSYVIGSDKMIVYDDTIADRMIQIYDKGIDKVARDDANWSEHNGFGEFQFRLRSGDVIVPRVDMREPLRVEAEHFVDCITYGSRPISDGESGFRVTRILEAAEQSMTKNGTRVRFAVA